MSEYYILDENKKAVPATLSEWGEMYNEPGSKRVDRHEVGDAQISTVFLGLDHSFGDGPPLLFETMIFGGEHSEGQWRCSTWDEAVKQHATAVALVKDEG